jgi:aerobic-type carbon monoxide dehydrogenase small subunit (CoxS/CutS family)
MKLEFELNGRLVSADAAPGQTLLDYLRSVELFSVKHGCDHGECGACGVLINDKSVNACLTLMPTVAGKRIETLENFSSHKKISVLQEAFLEAGAVQCGFCTPGMMISLEALDREEHPADEAAVRDALNGNLCRCTGYLKPVKAALDVLQSEEGDGT